MTSKKEDVLFCFIIVSFCARFQEQLLFFNFERFSKLFLFRLIIPAEKLKNARLLISSHFETDC